ncbi:MAG: hypothetical protein WD595_05930 [Waddliaceae bacterium]
MSHTWDIAIQYQRCPECKRIFESRGAFEYREKKYVKELCCPFCAHAYTDTKEYGSVPLIGTPQPVEWDWG